MHHDTPNPASLVDSKLQQRACITCEMEIHLLHGDDLCSTHHVRSLSSSLFSDIMCTCLHALAVLSMYCRYSTWLAAGCLACSG